jgi:hypothetical protein
MALSNTLKRLFAIVLRDGFREHGRLKGASASESRKALG